MNRDNASKLIRSKIQVSKDVKNSLMVEDSIYDNNIKAADWCLTAISPGGTFFLAENGGSSLTKLRECIQVPSDETASIQESHILIGHIICEIVEKLHFQHEL